jgi:hypothetical protein
MDVKPLDKGEYQTMTHANANVADDVDKIKEQGR